MFHQFVNRYEISGELIAMTPLHIGAEPDHFIPLAPQNPVQRDARGLPYIPGSSLKGIFRGFYESLQQDEAIYCDRGQECVRRFHVESKEERLQLIKRLVAKEKPMDVAMRDSKMLNKYDNLLAQYIESHFCKPCLLFGSSVMAGKLKFADAMAADPVIYTQMRVANTIDRDTKTVAGSGTYEVETIAAGSRFWFHLLGENLSKDEIQDVKMLLSVFAEGGIRVGGKVRAGLGQVELRHVEIFKTTLANRRLEQEKIPFDSWRSYTEKEDGDVSAIKK
ncbi:MAG: CRISPR-associated RAMP protein [Lachnospiraceae bacterium]|nr:CRISPR-associated RAMP protein [Lachnospiraceae bacterium]